VGSDPAGAEAAGEAGQAPSPEPPVVALDIPARFIRVTIEGPLSRGFIKQLGSPLGDRIALTMTRLLVWNMHLQKDPRPGDVADLLFEVKDDGQVRILALRYASKKYGKEFAAWSYKAPGAVFSSWFDSAGREVPGRLGGGPIAEFEEVTSLLGDGRGHSGMDFKAPVGTAITAPFDGTVTRSNWRWKYNGNCLELRSARGTTARFLHLSGLADGIVPGATVRKGQKIALSGNTGRSSAPHLHYELSSSAGKTLDPLHFHDVRHSVLTGEAAASFKARKAELEGWLTKAIVHRAQ
jgi:murein DD-endopeptidase MepM/ murein hydrolase activator NlpD